MADREYKAWDEIAIPCGADRESHANCIRCLGTGRVGYTISKDEAAIANAVRAEVLRGLDAAAKACGGAMTVSSTITEKGAKTVWRVDPSATHEEATGDTLSEAILKAAANRSEDGGKE